MCVTCPAIITRQHLSSQWPLVASRPAAAVLQAYGKTTYLVTTLQRVPRGTEGAVSLEGTLAGLGAALVFSAVAMLVGQVGGREGGTGWAAGCIVWGHRNWVA
jgi:uncharacterized membrane protein